MCPDYPLSRARGGTHLTRLLALWRNPLAFFTELAGHGDFVHTRLGPVDFYFVNHPELVQELMTRRHPSLEKNRPMRKARILLGQGLLTSDGELHRRQRRLIQPAFYRPRLRSYAEVMARYAAEAGARWRDGETIDGTAEMMRLTQRIVAKCLLDADVEEAEARTVGRALDTLVGGFGILLMPFSEALVRLPLPAMRRLRRARAELDEVIFRRIDERRRSGDRGDVLSMLLFSRDDDGAGMSDRQIRDEALTIFLAGHDTTGNGLAWTWHLLAGHSEAEAAWHRELDTVLDGRPPTADDVPQLVETRRVLFESMRLYPPVPAVGRQVAEDFELAGQRIRHGAVVQYSQWTLHRDPRFFPEPERFRPERWTPDFEKSLPKGAYVPFGIGPRLCIGMPFALEAGVLALATLGRHWRLRATPGAAIRLLPRSITLRPDRGIRFQLQRRRTL